MDKQLLTRMEKLRSEMVQTALVQKNLLHRDVLVLSQSLDQIIVQLQYDRLTLRRDP